jgi:4-hydroxy-tetrahydrodipicolinate synthase
MITALLEDGSIDYGALEIPIEWSIQRKVIGLFVVCQSSEMFFLSLREYLEPAMECVRLAAGQVPMIVSGLVAETLANQMEEAKMMADTGGDEVALISNRFAWQAERRG